MKNKLVGLMVGMAVVASGSHAFAAVGINGDAGVGVQLGDKYAPNASGSMSADGSVNSPLFDANVGLQAQVEAGTMSESSEDAVVELEGNSDILIKNEADLNAYNRLVIKARPSVKAIDAQSNGKIVVKYVQPARLFGIFRASLTGEMNVDTDNKVSVHLPWWRLFFAKDTAKVQTSVEAAVNKTRARQESGASAEVSARQSAQVVNAITSAINAQVGAKVDAKASAATY